MDGLVTSHQIQESGGHQLLYLIHVNFAKQPSKEKKQHKRPHAVKKMTRGDQDNQK